MSFDLSDSDERIINLELAIQRLQEHMTGMRDEVHVISKTLYTKVCTLSTAVSDPLTPARRIRQQYL